MCNKFLGKLILEIVVLVKLLNEIKELGRVRLFIKVLLKVFFEIDLSF